MIISCLLGSLVAIFSGVIFWVCRLLISKRMADDFVRQHEYLTRIKERKLYRYAWLNDVQNNLVLVRLPGGMQALAWSCTILALAGGYLGWIWFYSLHAVFVWMLVSGVQPIVILYMLSIRRLLQIRLSFLHAMEVFYQAYVSIPHRNIRVVIAKIVQENRMPAPIRPLFRELNEQLIFGNMSALQHFARTFNHEWGYTFAHFLELGMDEGARLDEGLQQFIQDLRDAQASAWLDRNRLLEIRIANFSPPLVLALFISVNYYFNPVAANHAYFQDMHGRMLLMQAVVLMVLSCLMGIWLSMRRT